MTDPEPSAATTSCGSSCDPAADRSAPGPVMDWDAAVASGLSPHGVRAIQVETTSICNFRCPSCPLALPDYSRAGKHMSLETFERILDAFDKIEKVELQGIGEVFLNPEILPMIRAAKARGMEVHTFSNGSLIDPELAMDTVRSGLDVINLSLDGADEATFRKARKGGTLERYRQSVSNLVDARRTLESKTPTIGAMVVLSKLNLRQVHDLIAIAEDLGMDSIIFTKMNAAANPELIPLMLGLKERTWLRDLPPYEGPLNVVWAHQPWKKQQRVECYWPQMMTYITVDGHVTPCCNHFDERELSLGNVLETPVEEIWNGAAYREFRRQLWSGKLPEKCRNC